MKASSKNVLRKRRGRPATGQDPVTAIRLSTETRNTIDNWAGRQADKPPRSEAIRRLIGIGLAASASTRPHSARTRAGAAHMAYEELDRHADQTATPEQQASRKRKLLKGPKEFREMRKDHK